MKSTLILAVLLIFNFMIKSQTTNVFTVTNNSGTSVLTCSVTQIDLTVTTNVIPPYSFLWQGPVGVSSGTHEVVTIAGVYTVSLVDSLNNVVGSQYISITSDTLAPGITLNNNNPTVTCGSPVVTVTASSAGSVYHTFKAPAGAVVISNTNTSTYNSNAPGIYTVVATSLQNGCQSSAQFTISSNTQFPSFNLSSPQNYTVGCATKSIAIINITNPQGSGGGSTSHTVIPANTSVPPTGTLSAVTQYTSSTPGLYYALVRDNTSQCTTQIPFTISSNTTAPLLNLSLTPNTTVLNCYTTQLVMQAGGNVPTINFVWTFPSSSSPVASNMLTVSTVPAAHTNSIIATYTLTGINPGNLCQSQITKTIYQNLFKPNAIISMPAYSVITCATPSVVLINSSTSGIPPGSGFPNNLPVSPVQWDSNVQPSASSLAVSYIAYHAGAYSLTVIDQNNGCTSQTSVAVTGTCLTVGLEESELFTNPSLFPNPSYGTVTLKNLPVACDIEVLNSLGQILECKHIDGENAFISLEHEPSGFYFLRITVHEQELKTLKVIKQ